MNAVTGEAFESRRHARYSRHLHRCRQMTTPALVGFWRRAENQAAKLLAQAQSVNHVLVTVGIVFLQVVE